MQTRNLPLDWSHITLIPLLHILALLGFFTFSWEALALAAGLWWITGSLGIGLGFHRLLAHRGFKCHRWFERFLALCGSLALQGGPIYWVGGHRLHHAHSDGEFDPHNSRRGFWWSHIGWLFHQDPRTSRFEGYAGYAKDLVTDPVMIVLDRWFIPLQGILGLLLLAWGGWSFVVWGIFVRIVIGWHCTWLVNSAAHMFGYQTYGSRDESRNCWWVALFSFGEGWHNNHHAFPRSARHGLRWWEIDQNYLLLKVLSSLGLAWNLHVFTHRPSLYGRKEVDASA